MAEIIGISKKHLGRLENNEINCKVEWIIKLIMYFGEDVREFWVRYFLLIEDNFSFADFSDLFYKDKVTAKKNLDFIEEHTGAFLVNTNGFLNEDAWMIKKVENYLKYKIEDNPEYLKNIVEDKIQFYELAKDYEMLPIIIPLLEKNKIRTLLKRITLKKIKNVKNIDTTYIYIYLKGIGELLKPMKKSWQNELDEYFVMLHQIILETKHHYLLPVFYQQRARYHFLSKDIAKYDIAKKSALELSEIFQQVAIHQEIISGCIEEERK